MKKNAIYSIKHYIYSIVMLLALAWLTISVAFLPTSQQQQVNSEKSTPTSSNEEEASNPNPFGNGTEEKTENGANTLSEYLHDHHLLSHNIVFPIQGLKSHPPSLYCDFNPELIIPPPKFILS